jgi:hypothetical protein
MGKKEAESIKILSGFNKTRIKSRRINIWIKPIMLNNSNNKVVFCIADRHFIFNKMVNNSVILLRICLGIIIFLVKFFWVYPIIKERKGSGVKMGWL